MTTVNSQTLTERQKGLAACACLMAQGDMNRLEPAVRMALDNGVTINELKEAFSQLYAYTGFPRSLKSSTYFFCYIVTVFVDKAKTSYERRKTKTKTKS